MPYLAFPTPEEAAMDGFPSQACRVAAALRDGDDAYVLLDTGSPGHPYLYGICVVREERGWVGASSSNGDGWTRTDPERPLGTATAWGEAPRGTDRVRAVFDGDTREAPVAGGVYLVAWWRVPSPAHGLPRAESFRIHGRWVPAPPES
jgi:hypothetical protein